MLSQSVTEVGPRRRSGRVNDLSHVGGEFSDADQEYSFVETKTAGVNTTPSLHNMAETSPLTTGDLRGQQGRSKLRTNAASGINCS